MLVTGAELLDKFERGVKYKQLEKMYGLTHGQIAGKIYAERIRRRLDLKTQPRPELFNVMRLDKPLTLAGDFMVVGDIHVPTTDYGVTTRVSAIARQHLEHPRLIIAGDLFNMDLFSRYPTYTTLPGWREESEAARQLLEEWSEVFEEIFIIMGNHERRPSKMLQSAQLSTDLVNSVTLGMKKPPIVSNYGWLTVDGKWRITHPDRYSRDQLKVAAELAERHHMNIISFHEHHLSIGMDKYKRYIVVNGGGLFDDEQMDYIHRDDGSSAANMQKGFVMLRGGYPYIFGDDNFTDYGMWLK